MFLFILLLILGVAVVGSWIFVFNAIGSSGGTGSLSEPLYTWNLYVAPTISALSTALILIFVNRRFKASDQKDMRIADLLAEKEQKKEEHIRERWDSFTKTQCLIKEKLDEVSKDLTNKVDWEFCHGKEEEIAHKIERLDDHIREIK